MKITLKKNDLLSFVLAQLNNFFPHKKKIIKNEVMNSFNFALERLEYCLSNIKGKYYLEKNKVVFNHLNSDHYCIFLYFFSNTLYKNGANKSLCEKLYYLNKLLNSVEMFYEVILPDIFLVNHPIGTVLGRAKYRDYLTVYQNCTIGSNTNKPIGLRKTPNLGKYLILRPGSSILGDSSVGNNCQIASQSILIDQKLPNNTTYFGNPKNFFFKTKKKKNDVFNLK